MNTTETHRIAEAVLRSIDGALHHDIDHRDVAAILTALDPAGYAVVERPARTITRTVIAPHIGDTVYRLHDDPEDIHPGIVTSISPGGREVTVRWLSAESITDYRAPERTDSLCLLVPPNAELTDYDNPTITITRRGVRRTDGAVRTQPTGLLFHSLAYAETALAAIAIAKRPFCPYWTPDHLGPAARRLSIDWPGHQEFYEIRELAH